MKKLITLIAVLASLFVLAGCEEKPKDINVGMTVTMNGQPLAGAEVKIDGQPMGVTAQGGALNSVIQRKYNANVNIEVSGKVDGYRLESWKQSFTFGEDSPKPFAFNFKADLKGIPYVAVAVKDDLGPVKDAKIYFDNQELGVSGADGSISIDLAEVPKDKVAIKVSRQGYTSYTSSQNLVPGATIDVALTRLITMKVQINTTEYGAVKGIKGAAVMLGGKKIGQTSDDGTFRLTQPAKKGSVDLTVALNGYLPASWQTKVDTNKDINAVHFFYPTAPTQVRVGLFRFVSNTPGEDIGDIPNRFQSAVEEEINGVKGVKIVDSKKLMDLIRVSKLNVDKLAEDGWKDKPLEKEVDAIMFGSIVRDSSGRYTVETKIFGADGNVLLSKLASANGERGIKRAAKEIGITVKEEFPFRGTIVAKDGSDIKLNIGENVFPVEKKNMFAVFNPIFDKQGKITGYKEAPYVKLTKVRDNESLAEADEKDLAKIELGARAIRRSSSAESSKEYAVIVVKSDASSGNGLVSGANIYFGERWVASTGADGKARVPVNLKKSYELVVYKHGFGQKKDNLLISSIGELKEVTLESYTAKLKIDTDGSIPAQVFVDNQPFARTPMAEAKTVTSGFHSIRISAGGQYRDWDEVKEFSTDDVDWTGPNAIVLYLDFLKQGEQMEDRKDYDGAIATYQKAEKGHPDYAEIHSRLAQLYLDVKSDPDSAIKEYETIMEVPEIRELIYKQFSIAYTNMGHAYHEKANGILNTDKEGAIKYLAKSIKSLKVARENTRFFPNASFDEAIHDTYYYLALSYQKLFQLTQKPNIQNEAELAWRDFLDFFPEKLKNDPQYKESLNAADRYMEQLKKGS